MESPLLPPVRTTATRPCLAASVSWAVRPAWWGQRCWPGRAALKCGAGLVTLGVLDEAVRVDFSTPELMFAPPTGWLLEPGLTVLAIGPGLGQTRAAFDLVEAALRHPAPLVVDADGLNCLAQRADLAQLCATRTAPTLLTPHPGRPPVCSTPILTILNPGVNRPRKHWRRSSMPGSC